MLSSRHRAGQTGTSPPRRTVMGRMDGRVAIVTGGARGMGRAHAVTLAREGASIVLVDMAAQIDSLQYPLSGPADLDDARKLVEAEGAKCLTVDRKSTR